ncbi:four helix bundle protein [Patescibacteria group bacterium]|nr:four helix bundle protein [Patescibacteria group bacterium]
MESHGFRFRKWDIYKDTRSFRLDINLLLLQLPEYEKYALTDQTRRALNSVLLNIAEGSNKFSDKETRVYINRAHCSLDETVACLDAALDSKYIANTDHQIGLKKAASLAKRLRAFSEYLNKKNP